jgi:hypothetical protein
MKIKKRGKFVYSREDLINYFAAIADEPSRKVMKTQKRPQKQKTNTRRVQELRRSNAAQPIPSGTVYQRKPKYGIGWEEDLEDENNPYSWS